MISGSERRKNSGFTLIELMIVVAIIGIIAGIAIPSYMESVQRSNRTDAKTELNDIAQRLQRCFTVYNAYNNANCRVFADLDGGGITSTEGHYLITLAGVTATSYTLTAAPVSGSAQAKDSECASFSVTHAGVKTATGGGKCW